MKVWHCFCSVCHCFCNLSVCGPCVPMHNWVYLPSGLCTYLCMMLSAPFFCVLCCLCVSTICVVSHVHPRLSRVMSCSLGLGCAGQSCVWDLCVVFLCLGLSLQFCLSLMSWGTAGKVRVCTLLLFQNWVKEAGNSRAGFDCTGTSTHECLWMLV